EVDLLALGEIVGDALLTPHDDVVPVGLLFPFPGLLVLPAPVRSDGEDGSGDAAGGELGFGILAQMPDQDDLVDASGSHDALKCIMFWGSLLARSSPVSQRAQRASPRDESGGEAYGTRIFRRATSVRLRKSTKGTSLDKVSH